MSTRKWNFYLQQHRRLLPHSPQEIGSPEHSSRQFVLGIGKLCHVYQKAQLSTIGGLIYDKSWNSEVYFLWSNLHSSQVFACTFCITAIVIRIPNRKVITNFELISTEADTLLISSIKEKFENVLYQRAFEIQIFALT